MGLGASQPLEINAVTVKMKKTSFSEMSGQIYYPTRCKNPECYHLSSTRHDSLKICTIRINFGTLSFGVHVFLHVIQAFEL
jgi:hypothetical protein